ncbi:MAG: nickel-type superoxide dismutase maturation protease [Acidimicrobiales bacterium]
MTARPRRGVPALALPALALAAGVVAAGVIAGAGRLRRVEVVGDSMRPTLEPGDRLLLWRGGRPRPGDLVAVADPRRRSRTVVKRLAGVVPAGLTVLGDNPAASTDSRTFGPVPPTDLRGRVVYRYAPASRRSAVRSGRVAR